MAAFTQLPRALILGVCIIVSTVGPGFSQPGLTDLLTTSPRPRIALVIDDMGAQWAQGARAILLPGGGPITYAILPHTSYAKTLAHMAHRVDRQVILHLPLEPTGDYHLHQGMLTLPMTRDEFTQTLHSNLESVPHIVGINTHMGSLLTQHPGHMQWLMEELTRRGNLFFVDSRTTHRTVAYRIAREQGVPSLQRDIFLDHVRSTDQIEAQFRKLLKVALRRGFGIGIGHPYPETLSVLEDMLPQLEPMGFALVPLSQLLQHDIQPPRVAGVGRALSPNDGQPKLAPLFSHQTSEPSRSQP